jgi:hypothetical protein
LRIGLVILRFIGDTENDAAFDEEVNIISRPNTEKIKLSIRNSGKCDLSQPLPLAGSHTCYALVKAGANVTILDDLSNSFEEVLVRLSILLGEDKSRLRFQQVQLSSCVFLAAS